MSLPKRLASEPMVHFLAIGAVIFVAFQALDQRPPAVSADEIVVTTGQAQRLAEQFQAVWRRPPTTGELDGLIEEHVREEVYVREALALGLDRDDTVVRQRLRQKMEFLTEAVGEMLEPSEAELREHHAAHPERFTTDAMIAFDEVFLGEIASDGEVATVQAALDGGAPHADLGQPILLPDEMPLSPRAVVDGTFGRGVFEAVAAQPLGAWAGPVKGAYGNHLIRLTASRPAALIPFESARADVLRDWREQKSATLADASYEELAARYEILRPPPAHQPDLAR